MKREDLFPKASRSTNHCLCCGMLNLRNIITVREREREDAYRYRCPDANEQNVTKNCNSVRANFEKEMKTTENSEKKKKWRRFRRFLFSVSFSHRKQKQCHTSSISITHRVRTTTNYCTVWLILLLNRVRKPSVLLCNNIVQQYCRFSPTRGIIAGCHRKCRSSVCCLREVSLHTVTRDIYI